jgi:thiamine-monophosphate kinase
MVTSLVLPSATPVESFLRLLDGIDGCCAAVGTAVIGGNLKEGPKIDIQAAAVGEALEPPLSRRGCKVDDLVAVVGGLGLFWAGVLSTRANLALSAADRDAVMLNVLTPRPKVAAGVALREADVVTSIMDNSDGLGPTLEALASANSIGIELDFNDLTYPGAVERVADDLHVDPIRLAMGWGDWQLVICIPPEYLGIAQEAVKGAGETLDVIGRVVSEDGVRLISGGRKLRLMAPDSQRFARDSWFTTGIDGYITQLVEGPLTEI